MVHIFRVALLPYGNYWASYFATVTLLQLKALIVSKSAPKTVIAIHYEGSFVPFWKAYCDERGYAYLIVDCTDDDIVSQIRDCSVLMWHFVHYGSANLLMAQQFLSALEHSGLFVFPEHLARWHYDDKLAQKYLFETLDLPALQSFAFYDKALATVWAESVDYPKVFKLRSGAGSSNVRLVKNEGDAKRLIRQAFSRGFAGFDMVQSLQERIRKWRKGKIGFNYVLKAAVRVLVPPAYVRTIGRHQGYILFQEFAPNNDCDIRVIVIGSKAFAIKRMVRDDDFRASGSGSIYYEREEFDEAVISLGFDCARKLGASCVAMDFVKDARGQWRLIENSYAFSPSGYEPCPGYWDENLQWYQGPFDMYGWMVEFAVEQSQGQRRGVVTTAGEPN
ncbi:hypothetical protein HGD85_01555 [Rhodobacteraceae bacterium R_SAG10]|nr:hypothetical protein [Rhodobacteraceae bacterium R_SAG10]